METEGRSGTPSLTAKIIIGMIAGLLVGSLISALPASPFVDEFIVKGLFHVIGQVFVISLKMLVVPLVLVSLVCGVSALGDPKKLGRVGGKTVLYYLATTAIAITLALTFALLIDPGSGISIPTETEFEGKEAPALSEVFINLFPSNPIKAMAEGNMLQVIVFAVLFGIALSLVKTKADGVRKLFEDLNHVIMKMVTILLLLAPYGVFALLAKTFAEQGIDTIIPLAKYFFVVLGVLVFHAVVTYSLLLRGIGKLNPRTFFRKMRSTQTFAFSTASSNATIPVTLQTVEHRLGANNSIASFTVPLGATINMDGTAIMQGVATVFIAQVYGQGLEVAQYLQVILTATLASIGTAGVPGVGLIMLAMVLQQVGLPVEGVGLIIGVDRLLDMVRTAVNVSGDATVTCLVSKSEQGLDEGVFTNPGAGSEDEHL